MAARRLRLQKAEADLVQKLDETMQEICAQVREHFDMLASPASGSWQPSHQPANPRGVEQDVGTTCHVCFLMLTCIFYKVNPVRTKVMTSKLNSFCVVSFD